MRSFAGVTWNYKLLVYKREVKVKRKQELMIQMELAMVSLLFRTFSFHLTSIAILVHNEQTKSINRAAF